MKIQRFSKHIKEQNWFAICLDLFIVFLAVFIGLQADNWNQERIAKSTAKIYYARLAQDMRAEESTRLLRIAYYEQALSNGQAALRALREGGDTLGAQFLIDVYQATQIWNYTPQRATYDELLSVGIANAIPDVAVRNLLGNYYLALENSKLVQQERVRFRTALRRHMPYFTASSVRENCGDKFQLGDHGVVGISLPQHCVLDLPPELVAEAIEALSRYGDLELDLAEQLGDLENKIFNLGNYLIPTRENISRLEELAE